MTDHLDPSPAQSAGEAPGDDPRAAADRLQAAARAIGGLRAAVEAGEPWPLAERFGTEPEAAWGPRETLAHLAEFLPFWLGEMERILDGSPQPRPFGRTAENPLRLGMIERDRSLPLRELFERIQAGAERYDRRVRALTPDELARRGLHPTRGEMTILPMLDRFVVSHLEEHVLQLSASLAS